MTHDPITLPAETARQLVYAGPGGALDGWTVAAITDEGSGRWTSYHRLVIRDTEGRHHAAGFESGLTEYQDTAPFEYDKQVEFRPVFPAVRTVEVTEWADEPPAPAAELMTDPKPKTGDTRDCDTCGEELQFLPLGDMDRWLETVTSQPHTCPGPKETPARVSTALAVLTGVHYSAWLVQIAPTLVALGWTPPAPAADLTPEQQHAQQIIRDLVSEAEFDDICDRVDDDPKAVHDLILSATVAVTWQDGEQAEGPR